MNQKLMTSGFILTVVLGFTAILFGQNPEVTSTPQRPTNSFSTTTTYPGWLELEAGLALDEHLFDTPLLLKYGLNKNTELFLGFSPLVNRSNGNSETGFGDLIIGGRHRFKEGNETEPSLAGQVAIKLPTADESKGLGSGEVDYHFLFILNHVINEVSLDINAGLTFAGIPNGGTDEQFLGIVTLSRGITKRSSGFIELLFNRSFERGETVFLTSFGGNYSVTPRLVLDSSINLNIENAGFDIRLLVGLTTTFAKIR